jgi:hypothetical protein
MSIVPRHAFPSLVDNGDLFPSTYASRSGVPIEIVSKVILRHANLSTTLHYLGKITDTEAMKWIENLYGKNEMG